MTAEAAASDWLPSNQRKDGRTTDAQRCTTLHAPEAPP